MSASHLPKVAGINSPVPAPAQTAAPLSAPAPDPAPGTTPGALIQDRLAGWVFDLTTLHELTERLAATSGLDEALREFLRAGAALLGARRGLVVLEPAEPNGPIGTHGPTVTVGLGLSHAELGHIETLPRGVTAYGRILDATAAGAVPVGGFADPDLRHDKTLDPRLRDVAARIGCAASYALPLASGPAGVPGPVLGAAVWFYDEPAEPAGRRRRLAGLYAQYASEHLARLVELDRARIRVATLAEELLPSRLPRVPGVQLAACHRTGPRGGGDWYDALPLPEGALGLAVGSVTGSGAGATAAMGRLRASLRAYAVMEGEDPVAVLSDLELLLRLTEPARSATVLFAYCEPARRTILLAGAGHTPPLIVGDRRTEFVETSLSAPLGMLACWEAPSAAFSPAPGETVLLCTDGLLRRTGDPMDRAFARLHSAAASVPRALLGDPAEIAGHVLRTVLPDGLDQRESPEDVVILAARFD